MKEKQITVVIAGFKEWNEIYPDTKNWKFLRTLLSKAEIKRMIAAMDIP